MLEVLGAGLGRTGTRSTRKALEKLGFGPCHSMLDMLNQPEQVSFWRRATAGEAVNWQDFYAGYRSSVNLPASYFWREIVDAFPDVKVILTVRDPERWYESNLHSIYPAGTAPAGSDPDAPYEGMRLVSREVVWDGIFGGRFPERDHALRVYHEHNEAVRRGVDAARLLVFDVADGWEPLCGFLGVAVPDEPFPHQNDRGQVTALARRHGVAAGDGAP